MSPALADLTLAAHGSGSYSGDDDPLLSCIDALTVDMEILLASLDSYADENPDMGTIDSALGRFVARMRVIRALHVAKGGAT